MASFGCPKCKKIFEGADALNEHHRTNPDHFKKQYKFVFRIRRRYYDQIVAGTKTVEYRRDVEFWITRIATLFGRPALEGNFQLSPALSGLEVEAVFICGKSKHTRELVGIERIKTPEYFSDQGKKDVNTPTCLAFSLGEVVPEW